MVISTSQKFVFFHIPRTGGTSISEVLEPYANQELQHTFKARGGQGHNAWVDLTAEHRKNIEDFFYFCFIRNPWDRLLSWYRFVRYLRHYEPEEPSGFSFFVKAHCEIDPFPLKGLTRLRRQTEWLFDAEGKEVMNFVGRFEQLQQDFEKSCSLMGIDFCILPHHNLLNFNNVNYRDYYDSRLRGLVEKFYEQDVEYGKYTF